MAEAAFHDVLFPPAIALGSRGGPARRTTVVALSSGHEKRAARWAQSRRRWDAGTGPKCEAEITELVAFFEAREGRRHAFRWRDPFDHRAEDQTIGTGDGQTATFQLIKTYGGQTRRITKPVEGSVTVFVDGLPVAVTTDHLTGVTILGAAPPPGAAVTASFAFDVPARFDTDALSIEIIAGGGMIAELPVVEVRD